MSITESSSAFEKAWNAFDKAASKLGETIEKLVVGKEKSGLCM